MNVITGMTQQIAFDAIHNEAFRLVLKESIEAPDFIDEFCRVFGCEKPERRASALEEMIDQATGYRQYQWNEFFKQFIPFVHRVVYMPLLCQLESNRFIWADNGGITSPFLLPAKYIKNWDYVDEN